MCGEKTIYILRVNSIRQEWLCDVRGTEGPNFDIYYCVWCDTVSPEPPIEIIAAEAAVVGLKGKEGCLKAGHSNPRVSRLHNQLVLLQKLPSLEYKGDLKRVLDV